ncbi:MAG: DUF4062 domain-containing protein [Nitrospirae bacterium]|nr:DUF4062 domain-containing protein [Nitrospirota bacterium]
MHSSGIWRSRPIFITSTFRDMHAERDYLRTHVFPELEERLRQRRTHLEPIDLRWGVETGGEDETHAKELLVLKVCLAEVERSRPFLIGLIGDRYGWVPPEDRMAAAAQEAGFDKPVVGRSVTDLEIEFGVLSSANQKRRCFFYLRDPLPYHQMPSEVAADYSETYNPAPGAGAAAERLIALRTRIKTTLPDRCRSYSAEWDSEKKSVNGLEAFGKQVLEDLWRELEAETGEQARKGEVSWQEAERWVLEQFIENRARNFTGREAILNHLMTFATSPPSEDPQERAWGITVTGPPGAGKSALFADLHRRLNKEGIFVLSHAAGISPLAMQIDAMLKRWIGELAVALGEEDHVQEASKPEEIEQVFSSLLGRLSRQQRVIVLIDALNQFEPTPRARHLTWLPKLWPPNARLIATAIQGKETEALTGRIGVAEQPLSLLSERETEEIAQGICRRYHRSINREVLQTLLQKEKEDGTPAAGNPLWLELAVEELNLLDADDFARADREFTGSSGERLHQLLLAVAREMPADVAAVYGWMLDRAEQFFGKAWAQSFVNLIAVSRHGWRESDLYALMPKLSGEPWDDLKFAALRRSFRAHVVQRGTHTQWDFAHAQMRIAVESRNLPDPTECRQLHHTIADYLEALPRHDPLHETETMVHLVGANDRGRAARYYASDLTNGEAAGATRALSDHILNEEAVEKSMGLQWMIGLLHQGTLDEEDNGRLCHRINFDLEEVLATEASLGTRYCLIAEVVEVLARVASIRPENPNLQRDLAASYLTAGRIRLEQGYVAEALEHFRASLTITERWVAQHSGNARVWLDLSISHEAVGDALTSLGNLEMALRSYQLSQATREQLVSADPENADYQEAFAASHNRIGNTHQMRGNLGEALENYQICLVIHQRLAAQDPLADRWQRNLIPSYDNLGVVQEKKGNLAGALSSYRAALAIAERLTAQNPRNAVWQDDLAPRHSKVGHVQRAQGDLAGAQSSYQASLLITERISARDPKNTRWQHYLATSHGEVGYVQRAQGDLAGALRSFQSCLTICERLTAQDPENTSWKVDLAVCQAQVGDVQRTQGDLAGALQRYQVALAVRECLVALDPGNTDWQRDLTVSFERIGDVLFARRDFAGALRSYQAAQAIRERLTAADSQNADWQRELSVVYSRVGDVLFAQRDFAGALRSYQATQAIRERLTALEPQNAGWQQDLARSHAWVGEAQRAQGDVAGALRSCQAALVIREQLAASDSQNAEWQNTLAWSQIQMGDLQRAKGDVTGALGSYQAAVAVRERLAAKAPGNAGWQRELSISHHKVGEVQRDQRNAPAALDSFRASLAIRERLGEIDPGNAEWQRDLVVSYYKIASLYGQVGENNEAAIYWQRCRDTLRLMKQRSMHLDPPLVQLLAQLEGAE